jgi:hypothetical protein
MTASSSDRFPGGDRDLYDPRPVAERVRERDLARLRRGLGQVETAVQKSATVAA